MDDTLVRTNLNFSAIKRAIACPPSADILTYISQIPCPERQEKAHNVVLEHELNDAQTSFWLPGAEAFVASAKEQGLPLAIVTRNCREATQMKLKNNNINISTVITREDAPAKPDPTALLRIADSWQIDAPKIAYLGDYIYDIQAAHNANMQAWLYEYQTGNDEYQACLSFIAKS